MSIKEFAVFLILVSLIVLLSDGLLMAYSLLTDELETVEVLAAIIGFIFLSTGVLFSCKHDLIE